MFCIRVSYVATLVCAVTKVKTCVCWQTYNSSKSGRYTRRLERSSIGLCVANAPINEMPLFSLVTSTILLYISCDNLLNV
jgi:hypothetical protein